MNCLRSLSTHGRWRSASSINRVFRQAACWMDTPPDQAKVAASVRALARASDPGRGPGIGPGEGGGTGGGVYRPGAAVTPPRLRTQVNPTYTPEALLRRVQGSVTLELVVTREGRPANIRVIRSLDPGGLDEEAIAATSQWQFEPGQRAGTPVDVLVTVVLDFSIR
jgi:TonB family protein